MRYLVALALLALACGAEPAPAGGCPVPYPTHGSYLAGTCYLACARGYADCDGLIANGCEVSLGTQSDCAGCGDSCAAGSTCRLERPDVSTALACLRPGE